MRGASFEKQTGGFRFDRDGNYGHRRGNRSGDHSLDDRIYGPYYIPADADLIKSFPPSLQHPMGTDEAGRDILARVLQGGRISLMVGVISTIVSLIVGVSYGATAGFLGGKIDDVMMRIVDIIYAIPYILIVIVLLLVFGGRKHAAMDQSYFQCLRRRRGVKSDFSIVFLTRFGFVADDGSGCSRTGFITKKSGICFSGTGDRRFDI